MIFVNIECDKCKYLKNYGNLYNEILKSFQFEGFLKMNEFSLVDDLILCKKCIEEKSELEEWKLFKEFFDYYFSETRFIGHKKEVWTKLIDSQIQKLENENKIERIWTILDDKSFKLMNEIGYKEAYNDMSNCKYCHNFNENLDKTRFECNKHNLIFRTEIKDFDKYACKDWF